MNIDSHEIKMLYWNANSVRNKIHELYAFLTDNDIKIACICETFLLSNDILPSHPNFITYRNDRTTNHRSGGVAIIMNRQIKHQIVSIKPTKLIENVSIEIILDNGSKVLISSLYLFGGLTQESIRQNFSHDIAIITSNRSSYLAMGDFNARHRSWNCTNANLAGNILARKHERLNFLLKFPSLPTCFKSHSNPSTIDLLLTNGIHQTSDIVTHTSASDHDMCTFELSLNNNFHENFQVRIPLFRKANWVKYQEIVTTRIDALDIPSIDDVNDHS